MSATASTPATAEELSALVSKARRGAPHVSADFAARLAGKTATEAKSVLFGEMVGEGARAAQMRMRHELDRAGLSAGEGGRPSATETGAHAATESMRRQLLNVGMGDAGRFGDEPISAAESMRRQLLRTGGANDGK